MATRKKKTIDVVALLFHANHFLRNSRPEQTGERIGTASLLEMALHQTGNYVGFGYLELKNAGTPQQSTGDETRRVYYICRTLHFDYKRYEEKMTAKMVGTAVRSMGE